MPVKIKVVPSQPLKIEVRIRRSLWRQFLVY